MTPLRRRLVVPILAVAAVVAGCGREAPYYAPPTPGNLAVTSTPGGAMVFLDGADTGEVTPATLTGVSPVEHVVSVTMPGYTVWPLSRLVVVPEGGSAEADFALALIPGDLIVESTPEGGVIWLDGFDTGAVTPDTLTGLVPRDYEVEVRLTGHAASPPVQTVTVSGGATARLEFSLLRITGDLEVVSAPAGAAIWLDGNDSGWVTPDTLRGLEPGEHTVAVAMTGVCTWPAQRTVDVPGFGIVSASFTLPRQSGELSVISSPEGAAIIIDGEPTGAITPHSFTCVSLGEHLVEVTLPGFVPTPSSRLVTVLAGHSNGAVFVFTGETGSLAVTSTPSGAAILLDDVDSGQVTPATLTAVPAGAHSVAVALAGSCSWPPVRAVTVSAAVAAAADFVLLTDSGSLVVTTTPNGALIFVDGENTGATTPATFTCVPPGDHVVAVQLAGHGAVPATRTVTVTAGQQASAAFTLTALTGSIDVRSNLAGAIFLDGESTGAQAPSVLAGVSLGDHLVEVRRTGYSVWPPSQTVTVAAAETVRVDFELTLQTGQLTVNSTPAGAAIGLDGVPQGHVTPYTLTELPSNTYRVTVSLPGHTSNPAYVDVFVTPAVPATADFTLSPITSTGARIVLLEAFSNVDCLGCPQASAMLEAAMATPGYGLDKMLLIKYAASWPDLLDPHYQANPAANNGRLTYYQSYLAGIPTVIVDGVLAGSPGSPPTLATLLSRVDAETQADPGFGIAVGATLAGSQVDISLTLTATRDVQNGNARLYAALLENPVEYTVPPGSEGETVFHWIMREFGEVTPAPLPLTPGTPVVRTRNLTRNQGWRADRLHVVAFVQDYQTRAVLQAGHAAVSVVSLRDR